MTKPFLFTAVLIGLFVAYRSATFAQFGERPLTPEQAREAERLMKDGFYELEAELGEKLILHRDDDVTRISLDSFNEDALSAARGKDTLSTVATGPAQLAAVKRALDQRLLLRPFAPPRSGLGFGGPYIQGSLRIQTKTRTIVIRVTPIGFAYGESDSNLAQRLFCSWTLAKVLDDMIAKATDGKQHLSPGLSAELSGEAVVEANKRIYRESVEANRGSGPGIETKSGS